MRHSRLSVARSLRGWFCPVVVVAAGLGSAAPAAAQVPGFGLLDPSLWTVNRGDSGTPVSIIEPGKIEATNGSNQVRSVMFRTPQPAGTFAASFTYEAGVRSSACCGDPGFALIVHNDARGASAIASSPDALGYLGIRSSVGLVFNTETNSIGLWTNGAAGSALPLSPVDIDSGNPMDVELEYDGNLMTIRVTDTVTGQAFGRLLVFGDIADHIGGPTGVVGVGVGTGDWNIGHTFSNFSYAGGAPCPADMDFDGELTIFDFLAFQNLFDLRDPRADFDGDGEFTIFDFLAFQNAFDAGCP